VADGIDAAMNSQQPATLDAVVDGIEGQAQSGELATGDDTVLALGERRESPVCLMRRTLTVYFRHNVRCIFHTVHRRRRVYARPMADVALDAPTAAPAAPPRPEFEIVPLKGLPIVGVVLVALVVAIAADKLWALEFFHVGAGALWTSFDLFLGFVLGPILGRLAIPARVELTTRLMPKMLLIMPTLVTCTLASGWQLGRQLGTIDSAYANHGWIVASYIVVGVMAVIALAVLEPANVAVLFELKKPRPNPQVIGNLMKRFIYTAGITGAMQVATLVIMTKVATG
jgi:hypothetical protein